MEQNKIQRNNKLIIIGLLLGSALLSVIFYIICMAKGMEDSATVSGAESGTIGFWKMKMNWDSDIPKISSSLSGLGITAIVFLLISASLLITGLVMLNKNKDIKDLGKIKMIGIAWLAVFTLALILALAGYVSADFSKVSDDSKYINWSIWIHEELQVENAAFSYTAMGIVAVIVGSLIVIWPLTHCVLTVKDLINKTAPKQTAVAK